MQGTWVNIFQKYDLNLIVLIYLSILLLLILLPKGSQILEHDKILTGPCKMRKICVCMYVLSQTCQWSFLY